MGMYDETVEVARRSMVLFFLVDTSESMKGSKLGAVNAAIEEIVPELKEIAETNADARLKIATLEVSTGSRWITKEPVEAEQFHWNPLSAEGVTDFGDACISLDKKLVKSGFMKEATGSFAPVIFLLSDGEPTDNYKKGLELLRNNPWFRAAIKVAVAIGEDANTEILSEFTGNRESVITVYSSESLKKWIRFVSVRASEVGSQSADVSVVTEHGDMPRLISKQEELNREIQLIEAEDFESYEGDVQW